MAIAFQQFICVCFVVMFRASVRAFFARVASSVNHESIGRGGAGGGKIERPGSELSAAMAGCVYL
jgi:hypothetical protein